MGCGNGFFRGRKFCFRFFQLFRQLLEFSCLRRCRSTNGFDGCRCRRLGFRFQIFDLGFQCGDSFFRVCQFFFRTCQFCRNGIFFRLQFFQFGGFICGLQCGIFTLDGIGFLQLFASGFFHGGDLCFQRLDSGRGGCDLRFQSRFIFLQDFFRADKCGVLFRRFSQLFFQLRHLIGCLPDLVFQIFLFRFDDTAFFQFFPDFGIFFQFVIFFADG